MTVHGVAIFDRCGSELDALLDLVDRSERALREVRAALQRGERGAALTAARDIAGLAAQAGDVAVGMGLRRIGGAVNALPLAQYAVASAREADRAVQLPPSGAKRF